MGRMNKCKLSFAVRRYYSTGIVSKPISCYFTHPFPLANSSISFQNLTRSCGFSSSAYFRQRFSHSGHLNRLYRGCKRFYSSLDPMVAAFMAAVVFLCGFLYFRSVKVPYTHRRRILMSSDVDVSKIGEMLLNNRKIFKGGIIPANDPRSVKVCSILKNLVDTLYKDIGLDEIPRITYFGFEDSIVTESKDKGIADMSFKQIRKKNSGWRTDISHLKGKKWQFLVVDDLQNVAFTWGDGIILVYAGLLDTYSDVGIATILAQQVGHCVARHCAEAWIVLSDVSVFDKQMSKTLNKIRYFRPLEERQEREADYISLLLMASAGYDPLVVSYEKLAYYQDKKNVPIPLDRRMELLSEPRLMEKACSIYKKTIGSK